MSPQHTCQVADPELTQMFSCHATEAGGITCENTAPEHGDQHWISVHTINHALAGNGYSCAAITSITS